MEESKRDWPSSRGVRQLSSLSTAATPPWTPVGGVPMFGTIRIIKQNQPQKQAKQGSPQTTPACPGRTSSHHHNHVHWRAQPRNLMRVLWLALTCGGVGIALGAFWNAIGTCHVQ